MIQPLHAADLAAANDIKVYTIAAGITGLAPMPVTMQDGSVSLRRARVEIDEQTLRDIAPQKRYACPIRPDDTWFFNVTVICV